MWNSIIGFNFFFFQINYSRSYIQTSWNIICRKDKIYEVFSLNFFNQYLNSIYKSLPKFNYMKVLIYFERFKYNTGTMFTIRYLLMQRSKLKHMYTIKCNKLFHSVRNIIITSIVRIFENFDYSIIPIINYIE